MGKAYYDIASITGSVHGGNACALALIINDAEEVSPAGTTIYSMSMRDKNDEYLRYADMYDLSFIFDDHIPPVDFYSVPRVDIFAFDGKGGLFGTVGQTTDLECEAPVCYINNERRCFFLAGSLREFIDGLEHEGKPGYEAMPYDGVEIFRSLAEAKAYLSFIEIDPYSFSARGV